MCAQRHFTTAEAREIGTRLGMDWGQVDLDQLRRGLDVELEHGAHDPLTNVTNDDLELTAKIAWAHLKESRDYYTRLDVMEAGTTRSQLLIDRFLPSYDVTYVCETSVDAPPDETYMAIRQANLRDPVVDALFAIREFPLRIARKLRGGKPTPPSARKVTFSDVAQMGPGWVSLAEEPGVELVVGAVGRFWRKDYGGRAVTADQFVPFNEPGYAKLTLSLSVRPAGTGSIVRYEARTATTDVSARRTFGRYWRLIAPGVGLVMRRVVQRIKAETERQATLPVMSGAGV